MLKEQVLKWKPDIFEMIKARIPEGKYGCLHFTTIRRDEAFSLFIVYVHKYPDTYFLVGAPGEDGVKQLLRDGQLALNPEDVLKGPAPNETLILDINPQHRPVRVDWEDGSALEWS